MGFTTNTVSVPGGADNAGVENRHGIAGVENTGVEIVARHCRGGKYRSGICGS